MRQDKADRSVTDDLRRQLQAISRFATTAMQTGSVLAELLQQACQAACDGSGLGRAKAMIHNPDRDDLTIEAGVGWHPGVVGMRLPANKRSTLGPALRAATPVVINDLPNDPGYDYVEPLRSHGIVSLVNVPIVTSGSVLGILEIDSDEPIELDDDDVSFLEGLAGLVAATIVRVNFERAASQAAAAAVTLAAEREVLSSEFEHRVANHLYQVQLGLQLEMRRLHDEASREALGRAADRMGSVLRLHRSLGRDQTGEARALSMRPFLQTLARDFGQTSGVAIEVDADDVMLPMKVGVSVGRLVNEIVMNSLKHAFAGRPAGRVVIRLVADKPGQVCSLVVTDDGLGMGPARAGGRGLELIGALAAQVGGEVRQDETPETGGTRFWIDFPYPAGEAAPGSGA